MALCSLSTGTIWPGAAAALTSGPPTISDSLLARASVRAGLQRGEGRAQPDRAGDAVEHHVGAEPGEPRCSPRARPAPRARSRARPASRAACVAARRGRPRRCPAATPTASTRSATACCGEQLEVAAAGADARSTRNRSGLLLRRPRSPGCRWTRWTRGGRRRAGSSRRHCGAGVAAGAWHPRGVDAALHQQPRPARPVRARCRRTWSRGTPRCPRSRPRGRSRTA